MVKHIFRTSLIAIIILIKNGKMFDLKCLKWAHQELYKLWLHKLAAKLYDMQFSSV